MINTITPANNIVQSQNRSDNNYLNWLDFFDPAAALEYVRDYVESLPSSRYERHTMRAYMQSLGDFCAFMGADVTHLRAEKYLFNFDNMRMPNKAEMNRYISFCKQRGLTSATVTRYLASVRHFLRALEEQQVIPRSGNDFVLIMEAQRQLRLASGVKNPRPDRNSSRPALEQHGKRMSLNQVNQLFDSFSPGACELPDITTIAGKRDLALLYLGITSGLRAAEIARLTLSMISEGKGCYDVQVRGKRANVDPIGIDHEAYDLIIQYVDAFNEALPLGDPRRIDSETILFQPILHGDNIPAIGLRGNTANNGLSQRAILKIVSRRTYEVLGIAVTAHDMRRTCAYLMRSNGYEWDDIRNQLRHKSIATTERYVGKEQNRSRSLLSNKVRFNVPKDERLI